MDESVGPCQCDCPDRIMRLLTPIRDLPNPGYAADWRARVEARKNAKRQQRERRQSLRVGSIVTLPTAASFRGGFTASRFRVAQFRRRTPIFEALDPPGFLCRLPAATLAAGTIAAPPIGDLEQAGVLSRAPLPSRPLVATHPRRRGGGLSPASQLVRRYLDRQGIDGQFLDGGGRLGSP
jgi:Domain of unknown function (DUF6927)